MGGEEWVVSSELGMVWDGDGKGGRGGEGREVRLLVVCGMFFSSLGMKGKVRRGGGVWKRDELLVSPWLFVEKKEIG